MLMEHDNKFCGIFYYRPSTVIVGCSFWSNIEIVKNDYTIEAILSGDRYLVIEKCIERVNWNCEKIAQDIKNSIGKVFFINNSPYLKPALKPLNTCYYQPPLYRGGLSHTISPKVVFTELTSFKEEGHQYSEKEELIGIVEELGNSEKIKINPDSGFNIGDERYLNSLLMLVKPMLPYLIMEEMILN